MQMSNKESLLAELIGTKRATDSSNMQQRSEEELVPDSARKHKRIKTSTHTLTSSEDCSADKHPNISTAMLYGSDHDTDDEPLLEYDTDMVQDNLSVQDERTVKHHLAFPSYVFDDNCKSIHAYICTSSLGKSGEDKYVVYTILVGDEVGELHYSESGRVPPKFRQCSVNGTVFALERLLTTICSNDGEWRMRMLHVHSCGDYLQKTIESYLPYWKENGWRLRDGAPVVMKPVLQRIESLLLSPTSPERMTLCTEPSQSGQIGMSAVKYEMGSHSWWLARARGCSITYLFQIQQLETMTDKAIVGVSTNNKSPHSTPKAVHWFNKK